MPDFNPIKDAKNFQQQYVSGGRFTDEEYETGVGWLSDYIDALVKALRETDEAMHARSKRHHANRFVCECRVVVAHKPSSLGGLT